jgi:hypothetical protein
MRSTSVIDKSNASTAIIHRSLNVKKVKRHDPLNLSTSETSETPEFAETAEAAEAAQRCRFFPLVPD